LEKLIKDDSDVYLALLFYNHINPKTFDNMLIYCLKNDFFDTATQLIELKDINLDYQNSDGNTALMIACEKEQVEIVKLLLKKKVKINTQNDKQETALFFALDGYNERKILDIIKILFYNKINLGLTDVNETSALLKASAYGFDEIVKFLIFNGNSNMINYTNKFKESPLSVAKSNGNLTSTDILVESGAVEKLKKK
jgi:ankyrin repeat protein